MAYGLWLVACGVWLVACGVWRVALRSLVTLSYINNLAIVGILLEQNRLTIVQ